MNQPEQESSFYTNQARHVRQCWREAKLVGWIWLVSLVVPNQIVPELVDLLLSRSFAKFASTQVSNDFGISAQ